MMTGMLLLILFLRLGARESQRNVVHIIYDWVNNCLVATELGVRGFSSLCIDCSVELAINTHLVSIECLKFTSPLLVKCKSCGLW